MALLNALNASAAVLNAENRLPTTRSSFQIHLVDQNQRCRLTALVVTAALGLNGANPSLEEPFGLGETLRQNGDVLSDLLENRLEFGIALAVIRFPQNRNASQLDFYF